MRVGGFKKPSGSKANGGGELRHHNKLLRGLVGGSFAEQSETTSIFDSVVLYYDLI